MTERELEWDPRKDQKNIKKHGIAFSDAALVFSDPNALTTYDNEHSLAEDRYLSLGRTPKGTVLVVCHTYRWTVETERIRIISARQADKAEVAVYYGEEGSK